MNESIRTLSHRLRSVLQSRSRTVLVCGVAAGLLILGQVVKRPVGGHAVLGSSQASPPGQRIDRQLQAEWERVNDPLKKSVAPVSRPVDSVMNGAMAYETPMIAHGAELAVTTKEFAHSRSKLGEILERHGGYVAKLRMLGQTNGSLLSATLRVPSTEFNGAVDDLKTLGTVEREEETAYEVMQQRAEMDARLANAQNRLQIAQKTFAANGKYDQSEVERQLVTLNAEIAQMEAQRAAVERQVVFATISLSMREEIPQLTESISTQFRGAALSGLSDAFGGLSAMVLFLLSHGPVMMLWGALLFFPVRFAWRASTKWSSEEARREVEGV